MISITLFGSLNSLPTIEEFGAATKLESYVPDPKALSGFHSRHGGNYGISNEIKMPLKVQKDIPVSKDYSPFIDLAVIIEH